MDEDHGSLPGKADELRLGGSVTEKVLQLRSVCASAKLIGPLNSTWLACMLKYTHTTHTIHTIIPHIHSVHTSLTLTVVPWNDADNIPFAAAKKSLYSNSGHHGCLGSWTLSSLSHCCLPLVAGGGGEGSVHQW